MQVLYCSQQPHKSNTLLALASSREGRVSVGWNDTVSSCLTTPVGQLGAYVFLSLAADNRPTTFNLPTTHVLASPTGGMKQR
uniref:Uncharacterized protein n=1 Tax=Anguilla anguilla TaxID=7936 RepID=A0A0E9UKT1_ANGAN